MDSCGVQASIVCQSNGEGLKIRNLFLAASSITLAFTLSACGGGGAGSVASTPPPPTPAPAPAPTPAPAPAHTEEYNNSAAVAGANAQYAYDKGYTGKGVTIAILDSGIDVDNPEFDGRISADSKSFETAFARCMTCAPEQVTFDLNDTQGHGTWSSSVAAAAKNDSGPMGIAYDSEILALKIAGANLDNLADGATPTESGINVSAIAPALNYAVDHGAFVMNISANGNTSGQVSADLRAAMDNVAANNRLVVQSVSNYKGDSFAGSITEDMVGSNLENANWFLFGLRLTSDLRPIPDNGTPGALASRTLAVAGADHVLVTNMDGKTEYVNGNSFAAPAIAGAAALLKQYWPQLGGKEISEILLSSATDLGDPGVDQIYGAGLLNIEAAFKADAPAMGSSTVHWSSVESTSLVASPAFGGTSASAAFNNPNTNTVVLDKYGRDYRMNVASLVGGMRSGGISIADRVQGIQHSVLTPTEALMGATSYAGSNDARIDRLATQSFAYRLSPKSVFYGQINSTIDSPELITGSLLKSSNIATFGSSATLATNGTKYTVGYASADNALTRSDTTRVALQLRSGLLASYITSQESGSALGLRGAGALSIDSAHSDFISLGWNGNLAGFNLTGEAMAGRTKANTPDSLIAFADTILSSGFRIKAEHNAFGGNMIFGITSPLKVERANLSYTAPYAYDYRTGAFQDRTTLLSLAPSARQMNFELGWSRAFGGSQLSFNGAYAINDGNIQGQSCAAGWVRFTSIL